MMVVDLINNISDPVYRAKLINVSDTIENWLSEFGGFQKKCS
ncbi:Hypothetical protein GbCGDNIH9_8553 [Granulibacter bethesdensis]|uniref:Uncharacterized protein n=1 Tax=Granulibacter bethesdensis TaxID=364410 RepID=A0AAC9KEB2_9PROT|nr:Hypothetical protein GbCGDNIH9_8553 [Granulibacter bethesdensis]APH62239.1 Hypothetical protein GbCGDNIH8_8553 [Granulibacter bethesdensis]